MAGARTFTELKFWQRARVWSKEIFHASQKKPFVLDRKLWVQVNDSSDSVTANVAEGFGRGTQGEFVLFLGYSLGSLNETQSHLCTAYDREYITKEEFGGWFQEGTEIRKMTVAFIKSMVMPGSGVKHQRKYVSWTEQVWENYERITGQKRPALFETEESRNPRKRITMMHRRFEKEYPVQSTQYPVLSTEYAVPSVRFSLLNGLDRPRDSQSRPFHPAS